MRTTAWRWWIAMCTTDRRFLKVLFAVAVFSVCVGIADALWTVARHRSSVERASVLAKVKSSDGVSTVQPAPRDFTFNLPETLPLDDFVRDASAWASKAHLQLSALAVTATNGRAQGGATLPNGSVSCEVRGSYANTKTWLHDLTARYPSLAVVALDMRKVVGTTDSTEVATMMQFRLYARPGMGVGQ